MLGVQDFIGYYDWTFEYLRRKYGEDALRQYWRSIGFDSQRHARRLFLEKGFDGMYEYWAHTLEMEEAGYTFDRGEDHFRIDMFDCPSKGQLVKRGLQAYHDYCEHCMGWIKAVMDEAGFLIDHEHNHAGQCWWEMHRVAEWKDRTSPPPLRGANDVWNQGTFDLYVGSKRVEPPTRSRK
jgi:hypothetical protein